MIRLLQSCKTIAVLFVGTLAILFGAPDASAQKSMTYEQAYRKCKAQLDVTFPKGNTNTAGRNTAGAGCMHDLGFQLKKSTNF